MSCPFIYYSLEIKFWLLKFNYVQNGFELKLRECQVKKSKLVSRATLTWLSFFEETKILFKIICVIRRVPYFLALSPLLVPDDE